jgi:hypothetical protein
MTYFPPVGSTDPGASEVAPGSVPVAAG